MIGQRLSRVWPVGGWLAARLTTTKDEQAVRTLHDQGAGLLTSLAPLTAPARLAPNGVCPCRRKAHCAHIRPAIVATVLGLIAFTPALYHCPTCGTPR